MPRGFRDVHLAIHSSVDALDLVQAVTEYIVQRLGLDEETRHWTTMAVRESVINAIVHGNKDDAARRVFIDFTALPEADPADLVVRVRDQGQGFDPAALKDPLTPENVLKASGRGIFLIRHFMDDVSMHRTDSGMEVRMVKRLRAT